MASVQTTTEVKKINKYGSGSSITIKPKANNIS